MNFYLLIRKYANKATDLFQCVEIIFSDFDKKKISEYERFLATPVFGFCQRQMMWAPARTTPVEQVPPPVQLCTPISADQHKISQKLRLFSCGMYLFYDNHYFR